jgi:actin-like ATPase involved in cell morphogenesis
MADETGYALGVDLGTTYSAAAVARGDVVEVCTLGTTAPQVPSVVVLRDDGEILTGEAAERRAVGEPTRTAREFKRRLGDPVPVIVGTTPYGAEALMAHLLRSIVEQVTEREGSAPDVVVLTHPANYSEYKTGLLREAARLAALDLDRVLLVTEPAAAAISYARQQRVEVGEVVAVYDFGGGTFDAAVVRKTEAGFEPIGTPEGMERLGGIDIDQAVLAHVDGSLGGLVSAADPSDPQVRAGQARLRDECRRAKEALSTDTDTSIPVSLPGVQTEVRLTRDELENMVRPRIAETAQALERAIRSSGVELTDVSRVLLVGGSSRIPAVAQLVRERTGVPVAVDAHPKFAIATGAALLGAAGSRPEALSVVAPVSTVPTAPGGVGAASGGLAAGAAAGVGFTATLGAAAVLGHDSAAAATTGGSVAAAGPGGVALGAGGPVGAPAAAGPAGVAASAGPGGTALQTTAKVAKRARPRGVMLAGAAAGVALAAGTVVVLSGGDGATTTPTTLATASGAGGEPSTTAAPATTVDGTARRGLTGAVDLVAGNGSDDGAGRPGPAGDASLGSQARFAVAPNGDVFTISASPVVLLVHDGTVGEIYAGGDGEFAFGGIAVGPDGAAYVTMSTGVKRIGADGSSELVMDANAEGLGSLFGAITFDGAGSFYFYDKATYRVLRYGADGSLSHVAGSGTQGTAGQPPAGDGGPAVAAPLSSPVALVVDGLGNLLIADSGQAVVRSVGVDGTITTIAGGGAELLSGSIGDFASDGTAATDLQLGQVNGVAVDGDGRVYISDGLHRVIVRFARGAGIELVIGDQADGVEAVGRPANETRVRSAGPLAVDSAGDLLYIDSNSIRRIVRATS